MPRVKGLAFVSLFALALSAQPVLSQDRNSDLPQPTSRGTNADAPPPSPQDNPAAKPPRQRANVNNGDGTRQGPPHGGHQRHRDNDPSQAQSSDGNGSSTKRSGPPPGPPSGNQPTQGSDSRN